jgi:hypothetical protein
MDAELKQYLEGMESRLTSKVSDMVSRADLKETETRLLTHMERIARESEGRSRAYAEEVETRLLGEFWKWARTADARYRQNMSVVALLDDRVQLVEDRISELERHRKAS